MTTDINKLLERLRTYYGDDLACRMLLMDARHALEAMAGEVENLKHDIARHMTIANEAAAERDRLKAALVEVEDRLNCRGYPDVAHYCPNCDNSLHNAREIARKALGGDA